MNAYRICIARNNPETKELECRSLYRDGSENEWSPLSIGKALKGSWYVGSKPEFCLSYYTGLSDLDEGEFEVLLTLTVSEGVLPPKEEDSYMGSEGIAKDPIVEKISLVK